MNLFENTYLLSQVLGGIGAIIAIAGPQFPKRWQMLLSYALCNLFWGAHFFVLGAMVGALMSLIGSVRFIVSIYSRALWILLLFIGLNVWATWFTWDIWYVNLLALGASLAIILSSFVKTDRAMRLLVILGTFGWILYDLTIMTWVGIITNTGFLLSSIIGFWRHEVSQRR